MDTGEKAPQPCASPDGEADRFARLRLLRSRRVGVATYHRLIAEHGSAQAALDALPDIARAAGDAQYTPCPEAVVRAELRAARKAGARQIWIEDATYPPRLRQISDPPPMLWAKGALSLTQRDAIALVGARNASSLGLRMAKRLAEDLAAQGIAIASGLARGVDASAHAGGLEGGTIAVVGGGLDMVYPRENAGLHEQIAAQGLILSEQPMGLAPMARHFPKRNRLIAGLSRAVVVIEAAARSGSLHTARTALDQGREVMAVPGHPMDGRASGTNMLIRDGAVLVRSAEDILAALPPQDGLPLQDPAPPRETHATAIETPPQPRPKPGDVAQIVLDRLSAAPMAEDILLRALPGSAAERALAITDLELSGRVERQPGGLLSLSG